MPKRLATVLVACMLAVSTLSAAEIGSARERYLAGDLDGASAELEALLAGELDDGRRAAALELLGRIAVDRERWDLALEAWGELTNEHALSPEAAAVSAAIRPLQALAECGCASGEPTAATGSGASSAASAASAPSAASQPPAAPAVPVPPASEPAPAPVPDGTRLVGGWGAEYEASQEVTARLIEFLAANGVEVRPASTEIPAIRGEDVVLSYLVEEARASGAAGVLFVTTRFNFREFIQVERYDANGVRLWREKLVGGTALKERRDRDKPSWGLVERMEKKLGQKIGTPELSTG